MSTPRFLIAKYTPDLRRMEPRNIGVIVWANGNVSARFAGESHVGKGGIHPPSHLHVNSKPAYRQWVKYWRTLMNKSAIRGDGGIVIDRQNGDFVKALQSKSKSQYQLVTGGEFMKEIHPNEIQEVADELYEELVSVGGDAKASLHAEATRALSRACRQAIEESGLKNRRGFREGGLPWPFPVDDDGGEAVNFFFDFAIHFGKYPESIMDRVKLWDSDDVYKTAFEFDKMRSRYGIKKDDCIAMVHPTDEDLSRNETKSLWKMLQGIVTVVDMRDYQNAVRRLQSVAATSA